MKLVSVLMIFGLVAQNAVAADLPARAPGLWKSTTTVAGPDGKPLANAVDVVTVSCVNALNDKKFFMSGARACTRLGLSGSGDTYKINGVCQQRDIHETLVYTDAKDLKLTAHVGSGPDAMTISSLLQWQGDCLAGMEPGDEGSVVNGAFSKADNINDDANQ
jgi:hypothetical protein